MDAFTFDRQKCDQGLTELETLLNTTDRLKEREHVQKFFKSHHDVAALIGAFDLDIGPATRLQFEFPIFGDFKADLVLGNHNTRNYILVEFEDAGEKSLFKQVGEKKNREFGDKFEHGFSQLVDWFHAIDDMKKTDMFKRDFGDGHVKLYGLLMVGRSRDIRDDYERKRLDWRTDKVSVDSRKVLCMTFDDFYDLAKFRVLHYPDAAD